MVHDVPPSPTSVRAWSSITTHADCIVVSQTPQEALIREWEEHSIDKFVKVIAGQERGTKSQHILYADSGHYADDHKLMIGDAPVT